MQPLVVRTWGLRGETPIIRHRTRHHRKISSIGGISISPCRRELRLYIRFHKDKSIRQQEVIGFLQQAFKHLRRDVIVVCDRLNAHRGGLFKKWIAKRKRVSVEYLPAYAPELNPVEYFWGYSKKNSLGNFCPEDVNELHGRARDVSRKIRNDQCLLRSFVRATKLPIRM